MDIEAPDVPTKARSLQALRQSFRTMGRRAIRLPTHANRATGFSMLVLVVAGLMVMLPLWGSAQSTGGQFGSWSEAEALGTARYGASAVFMEEDIYVLGGLKDTGGLSSMERLDLTSDAWNYEASLFAPRMDMAAVAYGGKVWVFGGLHMPDGDMQDNYASPRTYSYNPGTNEWSGDHAYLPTAVAGATVQVVGDKAYVAGGYECSERRSDGLCLPEVTDALQIYDFATDSWSPGSPLPTGVALASSAPYPDRPEISVSGGATNVAITPYEYEFYSYEGFQFRNDLQSYNTSTDSWTTCCGTPGNAARWVYANLPGLWVAGAGTWYDDGYHSNGINYHGGPPNADWQDIDGPPRSTIGPAFAAVGRELHVMGGYDVGNGIFRSEHFVYTVPEPSEDSDGDGVPDDEDQCAGSDDTDDQDNDGVPDGCDSRDNRDTDDDGVENWQDQCPGHDDAQDSDGDGTPDGCDDSNDKDSDGDGHQDENDNCPAVSNPDQDDMDGDGRGDVCDSDRDGDSINNSEDDCPDKYGPGSDGCEDLETHEVQGSEGDPGDGQDTATEPSPMPDVDRDGVPNDRDVCPGAPDHMDQDQDGVPDACDPTPHGAGSTEVPGIPLTVVGLALLAIAFIQRRR